MKGNYYQILHVIRQAIDDTAMKLRASGSSMVIWGFFFQSDLRELSDGVILELVHSLQATVAYCIMLTILFYPVFATVP